MIEKFINRCLIEMKNHVKIVLFFLNMKIVLRSNEFVVMLTNDQEK